MPTPQNLRTWLQIVDKNQNRKCLFLATSSLFGKKLMSRRFDVKCHLLCFIRCLQAKIDIFHTLYTSENLKTSMYGNTSCVRNLWSIVRSLCWIKHLKERCVLRQSKPNMRPKGQLGMWYLHVTLVNANYEELWNIRSSLEQKKQESKPSRSIQPIQWISWTHQVNIYTFGVNLSTFRCLLLINLKIQKIYDPQKCLPFLSSRRRAQRCQSI